MLRGKIKFRISVQKKVRAVVGEERKQNVRRNGQTELSVMEALRKGNSS